jgi:DNA-binding MarR family transcriptional regulator
VRAIAPADRLLTAIKKAEQATQQAKDGAVARAGLTKAQYNALLILADAPGLTGAELARRCFVTPQAMNETVTRLERDGYIERKRHPTHQHVREVLLTPAGEEALRKADAEVTALEHAVRDSLSPSAQAALIEHLAQAEAAASRFQASAR